MMCDSCYQERFQRKISYESPPVPGTQKTFEYYRNIAPICGYMDKQTKERRSVKHTTSFGTEPMRERGSFKEQKFDPPPAPNGRNDLWDLHYCQWWGWNWVRRRDGEVMPSAAKYSPRDSEKPKKKKSSICCKVNKQPSPPPIRPKKELVNICRCIIGMNKKPRQCHSNHLQEAFNTPSNSVVDYCEPQNCGHLHDAMNAMKSHSHQFDLDKTPSRQSKSSSVVTSVKCNTKRLDSSTEESVEYLTLCLQHPSDTDCACAGQRQAPQNCCSCRKANDTEVIHDGTQTAVERLPPRVNIETQTLEFEVANCREVKKRKNKKHKVCIVTCPCCCCCCCKGCGPPTKKEEFKSETIKKTSLDKTDRNSKLYESNSTTAYPVTILKNNVLPINNKQFSKFGFPSQNYPWLQSDSTILEEITSLKWKNEFNSPFTGKKYDLTIPIVKEETKVSLPEPIDISDHYSYMKYLESTTKVSKDKQIVVDAVCDAILNTESVTPSVLVNEFTYQASPFNLLDDIKNIPGENTGNKDINFPSEFNTLDTCDSFLQKHLEQHQQKLDDLDRMVKLLLGDDTEFNDFKNQTTEATESPENGKVASNFEMSNKNENVLKSDPSPGSFSNETKDRLYQTFTKTGLLSSDVPSTRSTKLHLEKPVKRTKPVDKKNALYEGVVPKQSKLTKTTKNENVQIDVNVPTQNYILPIEQSHETNLIEAGKLYNFKVCNTARIRHPNYFFDISSDENHKNVEESRDTYPHLKVNKLESKYNNEKRSPKKMKRTTGISLIPVRKRDLQSKFSRKVLFK